MDFNPLDLLASTALRDNSSKSVQQDTPDPQHLQPDDSLEEEDDEEADETSDKLHLSNHLDVNPCSEADCTEPGIKDSVSMGSVKTGKNKKKFSKCAAFIAANGIVAKKLQPSDTKLNAPESLCQSSKIVLEINKDREDLIINSGEFKEIISEMSDLSKEKTLPLTECPVQESFARDEGEVTPDTKNCLASPKASITQTTESATDGPAAPAKDLNNIVNKNHPSEGNSECELQITSDSAVLKSHQSSCLLDETLQSGELPALSHSFVEKNHCLNCIRAVTQTPTLKTEHSDLKSPVEARILDPVFEPDGDPCNSCDENLKLPSISSELQAPLLEKLEDHGSNTDSKTNFPNIFNTDIYSNSGNKEIGGINSNVSVCEGNYTDCLNPASGLHDFGSAAGKVLSDHCYAINCLKATHGPSTDVTDDSADAFESADEHCSAEDMERRPRSLSVDSTYLRYGLPGTPTSSIHDMENVPSDKGFLLSPTPSVESLSNDSSMSEVSGTPGHFYSILVQGNQNRNSASHLQKPSAGENFTSGDEHSLGIEPVKFYSPIDSSGCAGVTPKCGKFKIGTYASFSSSNLELDKDSSVVDGKEKLNIRIPADSLARPSILSPALTSPGSPFPLLQSPCIEWDRSDAGSEMQDDLDSSATEDKYLSSSHGSESLPGNTLVVWNHPVFHDHDYCSKDTSESVFGKPLGDLRPVKFGKRKYTKRKNNLGLSEMEGDIKMKSKGKYLKRELLRQDNRFSLPNDIRQLKLQMLSEHGSVRPNPVGRPRKRIEKQIETDIDPETGTKMKITGKFQDQYVYYLSKTSRNRRRKVTDNGSVHHADKIIVPAPKPGDIVVPHLSDADIEDIKNGGRTAFKKNSSSSNSNLHPQDIMADVDSKIVNTILSMESDNLGSPLPSQTSDLGDHMSLLEEHTVCEGVGFMGENMNLTPDQVDLLLSVVKDVEVPTYPLDHPGDAKLTTGHAFDFLTSGDTVPVRSTSVDTLAGTTTEKDLLETILPAPTSSTCVNSPGESAVLTSGVKSENFDSGLVSSLKQETKTAEDGPKAIFDTCMPPSSIAMPFLDKTLEFLKGDFKTDLFPEVTVPPACDSVQVAGTSVVKTSLGDNDTPWIVTVTIYWNDIPAIIINNLPYVRLVDIHKQILPAKDTGILKKRCQLMNIPVLNCSDMQRYFLVQYGRAYNSKSTLVITKDQAQELISYYVDPQPRGLRTEENGSGIRKSASYSDLGTISVQHQTSFASPRRRGGFRRRITPVPTQNPISENVPHGLPSSEQATFAKAPAAEMPEPSKRLRHKKINFLELLKGEDHVHQVSLDLGSSKSPDIVGTCNIVEDLTEDPKTDGHPHSKRRSGKDVAQEPLQGKRNSKGFASRERKKNSDIKKTPTRSEGIKLESDIPTLERNKIHDLKIKKRLHALNSATVAVSNRTKSVKYGPLKVKLKGLLNFSSKVKQVQEKNLFAKKNPGRPFQSDFCTDTPIRVLKIAHQDAVTSTVGSSGFLQEAEVHLDLYKRCTSPCIKCNTCEKFLSVSGFLQHQHLSDDSQSLTSVKQLQVLVPMNKENISVEEKHLWNEFVRLQKRLDRSPGLAYRLAILPLPRNAKFTEAACVSSPFAGVVQSGLDGYTNSENKDFEQVDQSDSGLAPPEVMDSCSENQTDDVHSVASPDDGIGSNSDTSSVEDPMDVGVVVLDRHKDMRNLVMSNCPQELKTHHTQRKVKKSNCANEKEICKRTPQHRERPRKVASSANIRTSSRKRKEKQFFSIENYSFSRKSAKMDDHKEMECDNLTKNAEHVASVVTLSIGPEFTSFTSLADNV